MSRVSVWLAVPLLALVLPRAARSQTVARGLPASAASASRAGAMSVLIPNLAPTLALGSAVTLPSIQLPAAPSFLFQDGWRVMAAKSSSKRTGSGMPVERPSRRPGPDDTDAYDERGNQRRDGDQGGPDGVSDGSDNDRGGNDALFGSRLRGAGSFSQLRSLSRDVSQSAGVWDGPSSMTFKGKSDKGKSDRPAQPKTPGNNRGSGGSSNDRSGGDSRGGGVNGDRWGGSGGSR